MSRALDLEKGLFDLDGQVALVTGAAQGLGRAIAAALGAHGAAVVLADRDAAGCLTAAEALRTYGIDVLAVPCDVSDPNAFRRDRGRERRRRKCTRPSLSTQVGLIRRSTSARAIRAFEIDDAMRASSAAFRRVRVV